MNQTLFNRRIVLMAILLPFCVSSIAQKTRQQLEESRKKISADPTVQSVQFSEELKTPSFISFRPGTKNKTAAVQSLKNYFELSASNEIKLISSTQTKANNITVDRYKQFYKGIPVEHSAYVVLSKDGNVISITAESYPINESFSAVPVQSATSLRNNALNFVQAKKYAWDALEEDKKRFPGNFKAQQMLEKLKNMYLPKGELVIAKDVFGDKQAHLAYMYDVYAVEPLSRYKIYVDAQTGKILLSDAIIKHTINTKTKQEADKEDKLANYQFYGLTTGQNFDELKSSVELKSPISITGSELGIAQTRYSGFRNIYTTKINVPVTGKPDPNNNSVQLQYSGVDPRVQVIGPVDVYILTDQTRGQGIETYDMNGVGGLPLSLPALHDQSLAFVDKDNNWKNDSTNGTSLEDHVRGSDNLNPPPGQGSLGGGAEEANNDDIAFDAHWGAEMVYDYWSKRHNRASFDNKNSAIKSYVHYGPAYDNAFWNGSVMTYGDGSGGAALGFKPLVSLDVCGHEIGHGVCSFTSDLVYQGESGAMNEALSDIWAAAMENFVDDSVKLSSTPTYQYFQVGEDIDPGGIGIRRMDNPKAFSDPDTYGGQNWKNPNCTPTLANDQCGVHSNSGVLNKWFYLVVKGPLQTTGSPAYTDDGVNDLNATTNNGGNNYGSLPGFIGIGHEQAEDLTYLMEQMLTPNATFADARIASISAAQALFGVCSQQERTVTDAWYAVKVGAAFSTCTAPLLTVVPTTTNVGEGAPGDCPRYNDIKINANLTLAQATATPITITVTGGTLGTHEYQLINSTITFNTGETGLKSVPVLRIFDDAVFESNETITITASAASVGYSNTFTITVRDNDTIPTIGGVYTLLSENFEGTADGSLPTGWSQIDKTTTPPIQWKVRSNGTAPLAWTGKRAIVEQKLAPGQATYDQLTEAQILLKTPLINGTGLDSLKLEFTYQAGGEPACSPACDYGKIMYSYDGVVFSSMFPEDSALYLQPTDRRARYDIPQQLSNRQFYIGFLWNNDANAGTSASITIDDVLITGQGKKIARDSASGVSEPIPSTTQEGSKPSYLYSKYDGSLMSKIVNASNNLGCVKDTLVKTGVGYVQMSTAMRTKKVHQITPSINPSSQYTLTLYYTNEELAGKNPRDLLLIKSNAADIDASTTLNSEIVLPVIEDHSADGYWSYTATFTGFSFYALVTAGNPASITYYPRTTATDLSQPSHWTTDMAGGTGTSPTDFSTPNQFFIINNNVANPAVMGTWTVSNGSNVILNNSNGLVFNPLARLNVGAGSDFNFNGMKVTLKSDATGTASIGSIRGTLSNPTNVTTERFTSNKRAWRLLGIPYSASGQTIKDAWQEGATLISQDPNPPYGTQITTFTGDVRFTNYDAVRPNSSIRIYAADNFNSDLVHTPNTTDNITMYQGYFLFVRGNRAADRTTPGAPSTVANLRITGNITTGNVTKGVTGTNFSLIPNPYPSPLDFDSIKAIPANADINKFYVWDATLSGINGVGQYRTIDITGSAPSYTYTATPGTGNNQWRFIEQGTAFLVPGSRTVDFTEGTKSSGAPPSSMLRTFTATETELAVNLNKVNTDNTTALADGVRFIFDNTYASAIDKNDAKKIAGFELNFGIASNNEILAIEKRPLPKQEDIISLKLWNIVPGNYQFEVLPANFTAITLSAYLKDSYLNTFTPVSLTGDTKINFTITADPASSASNRFSIVFMKAVPANTKPAIVIYPNPAQNGFIKLQFDNMPKGIYGVKLLSALGQTVVSKQINHSGGNNTETISVNRIKGTYMVEITRPDNSKQTNKVVIN